MLKRKFLQCSSLVNPNAVTRKTINGVEHIVVSSFTLPEDIVMNNIFYPASEIDVSFEGLNRTLAPVEHPTNSDGQFVSASDPEAIHNFHAGAFNDNAVKVGKRIQLNKIINVQEAMKTERGKRLLDRIDEVENSENARPIHTSTGIFLEIEELAEPQTNADGLEFTMIARNMIFDHDAILLDNIGAAQPSQGVGMAVNADGDKIDVERVTLDAKDSRANQQGLSHRNLIEQLENEVEATITVDWLWIADVFDDVFIIDTDKGMFEVSYRVDADVARVTGMPIRVERVVSYQPMTNSKRVNAMDKKIRAALNAVGINTDGMDEDTLLAAYNKLMTKEPVVNDDSPEAIAAAEAEAVAAAEALAANNSTDAVVTAVNAAVKPLQDQITEMQGQLSTNTDAEKSDVIKVITTSSKYPELDEDTLKALPVDKLKAMAANCGTGYGMPLNINAEVDAANSAPADMPE